jgi:hypothetical protein
VYRSGVLVKESNFDKKIFTPRKGGFFASLSKTSASDLEEEMDIFN